MESNPLLPHKADRQYTESNVNLEARDALLNSFLSARGSVAGCMIDIDVKELEAFFIVNVGAGLALLPIINLPPLLIVILEVPSIRIFSLTVTVWPPEMITFWFPVNENGGAPVAPFVLVQVADEDQRPEVEEVQVG